VDESWPFPPWRVLLLGGASGTGKTSVSYPLARHFGVGLTEVDDLQIAMKRITTPEQQPILHFWDTHREAFPWTPERILELHLEVARLMTPALAAVVDNHAEGGPPLVLEGDYLLPALAAEAPSLGSR
jgi:2-phosphoglycerate kinase